MTIHEEQPGAIWCGLGDGLFPPRIENNQRICGGCGNVLKYVGPTPPKPQTTL